MLSAVTWTVDQTQSSATLQVPDQPFELMDGTTTYTGTLRVRNQNGNDAGPWNVGNTAQIAGTIATDYVDGTSIQFLTGQSNLVGVNSGNYRPDPAAWNGTEFSPAATTGPGVFGGRLRPTINIGIPLTVDVGFFNFTDLSYDVDSGVLPIAGGSFAANTTDVGIESVTANVEGLSIIIVGQILPDLQETLGDVSATNEALAATITSPDPIGNPDLRELTFPIQLQVLIEIDPEVPALMGTITGQVVATATVPAADPAEVLGRQIFYNQSKFDGFTAGIVGVSDDMAIATDKSAYLPGSGPATFDNITSYTRGINGVMVDVANPAGTLTVDDFTFRMSTQAGANNTPSTWEAAPAPSGFTVRPGEGVSGSDRVEIIWANNAIENRWLEVIVEGDDAVGGNNTNTGLAESDRFYFGNRIGDSGSGTPAVAITSATDEIAARNNSGFGSTITNLYDYDRSGIVNAVDQIASRNNAGLLTKINLTDPPAAPLGGDSGVAIALAAPEASDADSAAGSPAAEAPSAGSSGSSSAPAAAPLVEGASAGSLASAADEVADESGLDDDLLDDLLS
ncbi:MAG: hypothetical protein DWQ37_20245 [Planctomycetota bacterium]|nr:MAG: hypothetical protein DWQ37_20245 [Planctomycetota bacterium]